jgi:hypothetical protein
MHAQYHWRARLLCGDAPQVPWVVLTDAPDEFAELRVRVVKHLPTGPMADDYLRRLGPTGNGRGAAAYHDKRFALLAALAEYDTAVYVDADSRIGTLPQLDTFPRGISVLPVVQKSVAEHLSASGSWRAPVFAELARHLTGSTDVLGAARWCHEALVAITKDGRESRFFEAWGVAADYLQTRGVYSGEGGVIGLAAACAGWTVDYEVASRIGAGIRHEGGGPKST